MSFSVDIQPYETMKLYGVDSPLGYTITSELPITKLDGKKITTILGAFREHTFAEKNFEKAEEKSKHAFNLNYKMNESDQEFYNKAIKKLNTASTLLSNIKK